MFLKHNPWKILMTSVTTLIATLVTTVFGSGSSKAAPEPIKVLTDSNPGLTIQERIVKIREEFSDQGAQSSLESDLVPSDQGGPQTGKNEELLSQYGWDNWNNRPWGNGSY